MKKQNVYFRKFIVSVVEGKMVRGFEKDGPVRIMSEAEGYLMVRRKGAVPFVIKKEAVIEGDINVKPAENKADRSET